jgi:hypothetical protein
VRKYVKRREIKRAKSGKRPLATRGREVWQTGWGRRREKGGAGMADEGLGEMAALLKSRLMITRNIYNLYGTEGQEGKTKGQNGGRGLELAWGFSTGEKVKRGEKKMMSGRTRKVLSIQL